VKISAVAATTIVLLLGTVPAWAADYDSSYPSACAVSGVNGKIEAAGGATDLGDGDDWDGAFRGIGSVSFPLGCMFGAQIDAGVLDNGEDTGVGLAGHLFLRDPTSHLIGVAVNYQSNDGDHVLRVGPEVELYLGNVSIEAWAGFEDPDDGDNDFFAAVDAGYYVMEDFRLSIGWRHSFDVDAARIGAEYLTTALDTPMSVFAEGTFGEDDYTSVMGGVRFYFGAPNKSLMSRHREDDPSPKFFDIVGEDNPPPVIP
jgi:hypothetical protein